MCPKTTTQNVDAYTIPNGEASAYGIVERQRRPSGRKRMESRRALVAGALVAGETAMGQSQKAARQQVRARRHSRKRRRIMLLIAAPVVIAAIVAVVALTSQPGYSGFDVLGKRPAIVQVFLPG
jgi:hypothetical protein